MTTFNYTDAQSRIETALAHARKVLDLGWDNTVGMTDKEAAVVYSRGLANIIDMLNGLEPLYLDLDPEIKTKLRNV